VIFFLNSDAIALIGSPVGEKTPLVSGSKSLLHLFSAATVRFRACKRSDLCSD